MGEAARVVDRRPLTPIMLAERWQCSERHIRNQIAAGRLRAFRVGGKLLRISMDAVEEFECQSIACASTEESSPVTWIDETIGRQRRSLGTTDRSEANRLLVDFEVTQTREQAKAEPQTIGTLWAAYRKHAEGRPVAVTMGHEEKALKVRFFDLPPDALKDALVDEHIAARRGQGRSDGTIWTELGHLRIVLSWAVKKGLTDKAPYVKRPKQPTPKRDYLTRDQFNLFLSKCEHPHLRRFVIIAMTTGARASAILDLTWEQVDFERGLIDLSAFTDDGKKRKNRPTVPMNRSLRAALGEARQGSISKYVIEWAGEKVGSVKKRIAAAAKRSKLDFVTPHVLRHSAAV